MIPRIAWRNLWRHRTRTLIMTSAVALTYGLMLVTIGIADDSHGRMLEEAAKAAGGDVLVHAEGYWATHASDLVIRDGRRVLEIVARVDGVRVAMPRVLVGGLVSTATDTRPVLLQGIRPALERALYDASTDLREGTFLEDEGSDPLVLGARIAERLGLELGDRVVLTATGPDGEVTRALFHLTGVVATGTRELDELLGYTTLEAAQRAVGMDGAITQIGVLAADGADPGTLARSVADALRAEEDGLEVLTWRQAVPEMVGFTEIDDAFGYIYLVVIYFVVLFSITNTFLMAVMERVRELGLLNALGLRGGRIARLLLTESAFMTVLAMAVGFLLAYAGHLAISHWGIALSAWGLEEIEVSGIDISDLVMYSRITPFKWIVASALVAFATIGSAAYPAWRASRLAPAEAMRFYE